MITILTWVSIVAGGILILLMLLSLIGGLDLDLDLGSPDVDTDAGGIGLIKGILTFTSVSSWVIKVLLVSNKSPINSKEEIKTGENIVIVETHGEFAIVEIESNQSL